MPEGFYSEPMQDGRVRLRSAKNTNGLGAYANEAEAIAEAQAIVAMRTARPAAPVAKWSGADWDASTPGQRDAIFTEATGTSKRAVAFTDLTWDKLDAKQRTQILELKGQRPTTDESFPTEKLGRLVELTGRPREDVARQFTTMVDEHGAAKAGEMLDSALASAQQRADETKRTEAAAQATQQREAQAKAQAEKDAAPVAQPPVEQAGDEPVAEVKQARDRPAELIALRKRESILKSLKECLA
jgi:hypothetical protein